MRAVPTGSDLGMLASCWPTFVKHSQKQRVQEPEGTAEGKEDAFRGNLSSGGGLTLLRLKLQEEAVRANCPSRTS